MWSVELKNPAPAPAMFRRLRRREGVFWLDAARGGRASFMSFAPSAQLRIERDGGARRREAASESVEREDSARAIARFVSEAPLLVPGGRAPRTVGFLGYDLGPNLEPHLAALPNDDADTPLALLARYDAILVCEPLEDGPEALCRLTVEAADRAAGERLVAALSEADEDGPEEPIRGRLVEAPIWEEYRPAITRALEYIAAGDVYQVNLARRFRVESAARPCDAYLQFRRTQPVPFGAFVDFGDFAVLSNAPERFLRVRDQTIRTEPIKGTHRRHPDAAADHELARQLVVDPKERAEHVMIVDLERNDLGRICEHGTVHVTSLLRLETFATLHHLVSTVEGQLRETVDLAAILRATFPGGSITGAPKIRASQVIAELEPYGRGPYTGALFWFRSEDDFDSSIAIRTAIARRGVYSYHAGGGIVADSDAEREYAECWLKSKAFLSTFLGPEAAARCVDRTVDEQSPRYGALPPSPARSAE